jgi:hypothetical protein
MKEIENIFWNINNTVLQIIPWKGNCDFIRGGEDFGDQV